LNQIKRLWAGDKIPVGSSIAGFRIYPVRFSMNEPEKCEPENAHTFAIMAVLILDNRKPAEHFIFGAPTAQEAEQLVILMESIAIALKCPPQPNFMGWTADRIMIFAEMQRENISTTEAMLLINKMKDNLALATNDQSAIPKYINTWLASREIN